MRNGLNVPIHIIGIGGTGMSAIAVVLRESGANVRGSDQAESAMTERLRSLGIPVQIGHSAENVAGAGLVLYSSAVHPENPELIAARTAGIPTLKRSEFLTRLLDGRNLVAVAGTHGKTTTTSMIAWILTRANVRPGFIIGSTPKNSGTNAAAGASETFVIEADEYDQMFLGLRPSTAVLTLIEPDHPDCFPTDDAYYQAFRDFITCCKAGARVLIFSGDPIQRQLVEDSGANVSVRSYGFGADDDYRIENAEVAENGAYRFTLTARASGRGVSIQLAVPGLHNVANAAAALAAVLESAALPNEAEALNTAAEALSEFAGSARRFETIADQDGVLVIDDYAHHPTEIRAALSAAKNAWPKRRIWALWQPHTFSRTRQLLDAFRRAFGDADKLLITPIYAARENENGFSNAALKKAIRAVRPDAIFAETNERAVELLTMGLRPGDVVLTLSAGDANRIGPAALDAIAREARPANPSELDARIKKNAPIAIISNLRVGGPAKETLIVESEAELIAAVRAARQAAPTFKVVGGLSNILFSDDGFAGRIIVNRSSAIRLIEIGNGRARIRAASGVPLNSLVRAAIDFGLTGLEWATRIPGSVGGAVYGNAGAYGSEINETLRTVTVLSEDGRVINLRRDEIPFVYRASGFKSGELRGTILAAEFELTSGDPDAIEARAAEVWGKREKFNFRNQGSLGSVFRNPNGDYAGRLITECGLRNAAEGGAAVSDFHGNIFVTNPGATAADFRRLVERVRTAVQASFGITLQTEIEIYEGKEDA